VTTSLERAQHAVEKAHFHVTRRPQPDSRLLEATRQTASGQEDYLFVRVESGGAESVSVTAQAMGSRSSQGTISLALASADGVALARRIEAGCSVASTDRLSTTVR